MTTKWFCKSLAILTLTFVAHVHSDIYEECNNKPSHVFIVSNTSCSHYIYCAGADSYEGECPDGDYFNELLQTCDPRHLVDCKLNTSSDIVGNSSASMQVQTTTTLSSLLFSTVRDTNETVTSNSIISTTNGTAASTKITSQSYDVNATTTSASGAMVTPATISPNTDGNTVVIISSECPAVDNLNQIIFVPHPKSCSDYFICYHGERLAMHCSAMLHFNPRTGKCDYPEMVRCQTDFTNPKEQCQAHTMDMYPHATNCNYFYHCRSGYLLLQQCPFGYGWDYEKRACTVLHQAVCYNRRTQRI
ncbi:probable chitinase 10 [Anastrepha obliqua]|uniref:probable chitinase 10 n=1 Tax=Anastrepha obliqua TaxID=95512 RepID=UPI00240988A9|nr:probable chitinase 10 [Anastrepha obliqua]